MKDTTWILGNCCLESEELCIETAKYLQTLKLDNWYYKVSFDKANRTSIHGLRGVGLEKALDILKTLKQEIKDIKILVDVHEINQVEPLSSIVHCVQIPAFLCRQTDLMIECAKHFDLINVKKGQWMTPDNMCKITDKIRMTNRCAEFWVTERGTQFGYNKLIVDFSIIKQLRQSYNKVILDCTHSTQYNKNGRIGGDRVLAEKYLLAASIFDYDGVFAEVHPDPEKAFSDADCQINLQRIKRLISSYKFISVWKDIERNQ